MKFAAALTLGLLCAQGALAQTVAPQPVNALSKYDQLQVWFNEGANVKFADVQGSQVIHMCYYPKSQKISD